MMTVTDNDNDNDNDNNNVCFCLETPLFTFQIMKIVEGKPGIYSLHL